MRTNQINYAAVVLSVLVSVALPAAVQGQFTFTTNYGTITITGYTGTGGDVIIPDTTNGLPVVTIGNGAFSNRVSVTSIAIPDTITAIGRSAFQSCSNLASLALPDSVVNIDYDAFDYCTGLTNIALPINLSRIKSSMFSGCTSLTCIVVPDSVTDMGNTTFYNCTGLTNIVIPHGVTFIGNAQFYNCVNLTSIVVPASATNIGYTAFTNCTSLRSISIAHGTTAIGNRAFAGCISLTNLTVPKSLTTLGTFVFKSCTNLKEIYFKGNAPTGDATVFFGVTNATVYYLPGTTGWGTNFCGLPTALWKPRIETSDDGFGVRTNQFGFNIVWTRDTAVVVEACADLANPVWSPIQTNILTADSTYFSDPGWATGDNRCYRLRCEPLPTQTQDYTFEINDGTITITKYVGPGGDVTIPETIIGLPVTRIGAEAFRSVTNLTNITIPDTVMIVGAEAFRYCPGLTRVTIPKSVVSMRRNVFSYSTNLTEITVDALNPVYRGADGVLCDKSQTALVQCPAGRAGSYTTPDGVQEICDRAFWSCTSLTNIVVGNSVRTIGQASFRHCSQMVSLTISENLDWFLDWAVADCYKLEGIYFLGDAPYDDGKNTFAGDALAIAYYLPDKAGWGPIYSGLLTAVWQP